MQNINSMKGKFEINLLSIQPVLVLGRAEVNNKKITIYNILVQWVEQLS
jgi:hypothetical protein